MLLLAAAVLMIVLSGCRAPKIPAVAAIGLAEEPRTLNIWLAGDSNSAKILTQIYQPLYYTEPDTLGYIPWLAEGMPAFDQEKLTYTVKLRPAHWSDGVALTAEDVVFTGRLIQEFKVPRYSSKWTPIDRIEAIDPKTVVFFLKEPYAAFLSGTLATPIVPRHKWEERIATARRSAKPLATLLNQRIDKPIGSGPFMLKSQHEGTFLYLEKNPYFFGKGLTIANRHLGPFIDGLLFKIYGTSDVAVLALKKGDIDMFWMGIQPGYVDSLNQQDTVQVMTSGRSALYFLGFNTRRPPFNDVRLRQAVALLIDKAFIVNRILQGKGRQMDTIVPESNLLWSNPNINRFGFGMNREQRIRAAYDLLSGAGYRWQIPPVDSQGRIVPAQTLMLPDGNPMPDFTILTPPADYDPHRAISGMMIQEWLRAAGMPVAARPMAFGALLEQVKARQDFDAFVMGYGRLALDPEYLGNFFHSRNAKPRGWNMSGYTDPEFDRLADLSQKEMNLAQRRQTIWQMQQIISENVPYIPLYNPDMTEAVRTDRFTGWVSMIEGIGNRWSFCLIKPVKPVEPVEKAGNS